MSFVEKHEELIHQTITEQKLEVQERKGAERTVKALAPYVCNIGSDGKAAYTDTLVTSAVGYRCAGDNALSPATNLNVIKLPQNNGFSLCDIKSDYFVLPCHKYQYAEAGQYTCQTTDSKEHSSLVCTPGGKTETNSNSSFVSSVTVMQNSPHSEYTLAANTRTLGYVKKRDSSNSENQRKPPIEIIGDNVDIGMKSTKQSLKNEKKDWHWFLMLVVEKRIFDFTLPNFTAKQDIKQVQGRAFLPSLTDMDKYSDNMDFHIMHVLLKHLQFLEPFKSIVPTFIEHPYLAESAKKTQYNTVEHMDANENTHDGMTKILRRVHEIAVPHYGIDHIEKKCDERIVFGGDVLTCERSFSCQDSRNNAENDFVQLQGVINRPEGFHRVMNLLKVIYQLKTNSCL